MVSLAGSRWALESDQANTANSEPSKVEETREVPPKESIRSENSANSGSLGVTEQRNTNPVRSTGLESQSKNNPTQFQRSLPSQANSTATVGLGGSRWNSAPALPPSTPRKKRRAQRGKNQRRNTNQARPPQSMAAEIGQSSKGPNKTSRAKMVQQPWAPNVPAQEPSNTSPLPSSTSGATPAHSSWATSTLVPIPDEDSEDEIL